MCVCIFLIWVVLELKSIFYLRLEDLKAWWQLHKNVASNIEHVLEAALQKAAALQPPTVHHENYPN